MSTMNIYYEQIRYKYGSFLFQQVCNDVLQIIIEFIGFYDLFDNYDNYDNFDIIYEYTFIPKKIYHNIYKKYNKKHNKKHKIYYQCKYLYDIEQK